MDVQITRNGKVVTDGKVGDVVTLSFPLTTPALSSTGKTFLVGPRGTQRTAVLVNGQELRLGVNAFIYPEAKA